jgi:HTH-type transcriptional regulator, sugar sensing transcriptional regulator
MNLNEARAYASLLERGASTGYEVSQHAGIPRSAVYNVLRKLVAEGAARRSPGPPERFTAVSAEVLVAQSKRRLEGSADAFLTAVRTLDITDSVPDAHSVQGYERIVEEAGVMIAGAHKLLVLSGWPRELVLLLPELLRAETRGVTVVVFSHAALPEDLPGARFSYGLPEVDLETFWQHRLVVVADDQRSLLGAVERKTSDRAVISDTPAIAEIAVSQISLDITLLSQRHGHDPGPVLAQILGDRIGRLDTLLSKDAAVELGGARPRTSTRKAPSL